jgi:putative transposase
MNKREKLQNIRNKIGSESLRHSLNSWSFYQLQKFVKFKLQEVPVKYIDLRYTSKTCSKCGHVGQSGGKNFKCPCLVLGNCIVS